MILNKDYWSKNLSELQAKPYNYTVLRTTHYAYPEEEERFNHSILALDLCQMLIMGNELYSSLNQKTNLNPGIIFDAIKAFNLGESFTDKQLEEYFKLLQDVEVFTRQMEKFNDHVNEMTVRSEIEFSLFGLSWNKQQEINNAVLKQLGTDYVNLLVKMLERQITVRAFIAEVKRLIKESQQEKEAA